MYFQLKYINLVDSYSLAFGPLGQNLESFIFFMIKSVERDIMLNTAKLSILPQLRSEMAVPMRTCWDFFITVRGPPDQTTFVSAEYRCFCRINNNIRLHII